MPYNERKRWKETLDLSRDQRTEDSEPPPPIPTPWPVKPGVGSPSATIDPVPHVKRLGNLGKGLAGIVAGLTALYAVGKPVVVWFLTRSSSDDVEDVRKFCAGAAASAAASAVAPYQVRMDAVEKRVAKDEQRWNALDKFHRQNLQRRNAPPVCQFGPKAESRGNACTMEELDTP